MRVTFQSLIAVLLILKFISEPFSHPLFAQVLITKWNSVIKFFWCFSFYSTLRSSFDHLLYQKVLSRLDVECYQELGKTIFVWDSLINSFNLIDQIDRRIRRASLKLIFNKCFKTLCSLSEKAQTFSSFNSSSRKRFKEKKELEYFKWITPRCCGRSRPTITKLSLPQFFFCDGKRNLLVKNNNGG